MGMHRKEMRRTGWVIGHETHGKEGLEDGVAG